MILLLDAGNSRFKLARLMQGTLIDYAAYPYGGPDQAAGIVEVLKRYLPFRRLVVASVLGSTFGLQLKTELNKAQITVTPEWVIPQAQGLGVRIAYDEPARLGADRYAALVGARHHVRGAVVIADCGTAVTLDALDHEGQHLGGLILPGIDLMRKSLIIGTAGIGYMAADQDQVLFGRTTVQAVDSGTLWAVAAAVDRIAQAMAAKLNGPVAWLLTGGDGPRIAPLLQMTFQLDAWLVLRGLAVIAAAGEAI